MAEYEEKKPARKTTTKQDEKVIAEARKYLKEYIDEESSERAMMMDDLRFCTLDQWPAEIRAERENDIENGPRPCLTIDKINQYIVQVVNDMRQGKPGINVRPQDDEADVETARILKGIIRNIEDQSNADIPYTCAGESAAKIGLGYFRITTEYTSADSFDQDIFIRPIPNTFSVYLGPHIMPDGSDAKRAFIIETMPIEKFRREYPNAKHAVDDFEDIGEQFQYWRTTETVTVVECFYLERTEETLYFLADGTTMTKADYEKWPEEMGVPPSVQQMRTSFKEQLKWKKLTGVEVLEARDLPGKYIPIVEVVGRESWVDGKRVLWGLVRPAKDSLRMYNYFASTITEKMGLAPKAPFIGAKGQFAGLEQKWQKANRANYSYLEYEPIDVNGNAIPPPQRQGATPMEAALLQQMQVIEHDVQTSLGMFKAAVGETESQQSGRAILALQRESDTGTYHFGANLGISIRHAGRIIIDLIPHYYDTRRVVRILGEDGTVQSATIDPNLPQSRQEISGPQGIHNIYNPSIGKYDVSITVGPSYNTKRQEAMATFVEMAKGAADPASAAVLRYLVMRNSDAAGADEASNLLKTLLPPQALQALQSRQPIPPEAQQMMMQAQAQVQAAQEQMQKMQEENTKLQAGERVSMAKLQVQSKEANFMAQLKAQDAQREAQLERWKAETKAQLEREIAEAQFGIEGKKLQMTEQVESGKLALQARKQEHEAEMEKSKTESDLLPKIEGALQAIVEGINTLNKNNTDFQKMLFAELTKPKNVSIGNVKRTDTGISGATVTIQ